MRFIMALFYAALLTVVSTSADARPHHRRSATPAQGTIVCDQQGCHDDRIISANHESSVAAGAGSYEGRIVEHPAGCSWRLFCGCGVSVKAFGKPIRELYLASNYGYYFNVGEFAPGNAAWRPGHVVYIMGGTRSDALVYNPNSGGHQTRINHLDLRRYRIADLRSPKRRLAMN